MAMPKTQPVPDELVSSIYQGPLEDKPWTSFLDLLRRRRRCEVAAISLKLRSSTSGQTNVFSGLDVRADTALREAYRALCGQPDPLGDALVNPGDLYTLDEVISPERLKRTRYYQRILLPHGLRYQVGMRVAEPHGWRANIGLMASSARGDFSAAEKAFLRALRPHFERALQLYSRIRRTECEKKILEETLDRLSIGAFILDASARVIDANATARRLAGQSGVLDIVEGRLTLKNRALNARLAQALSAAIAWPDQQGNHRFIDAMRIEQRTGDALGVLVRLIAPDDTYHSDVSPRVIVYVCDPRQQEKAPERFIAELFGLSRAEAGLASLLATGMTLSQAAEHLQLTENTTRTYSKRVFEKIGVTRQTDLVRLILSSVAPLARH